MKAFILISLAVATRAIPAPLDRQWNAHGTIEFDTTTEYYGPNEAMEWNREESSSWDEPSSWDSSISSSGDETFAGDRDESSSWDEPSSWDRYISSSGYEPSSWDESSSGSFLP